MSPVHSRPFGPWAGISSLAASALQALPPEAGLALSQKGCESSREAPDSCFFPGAPKRAARKPRLCWAGPPRWIPARPAVSPKGAPDESQEKCHPPNNASGEGLAKRLPPPAVSSTWGGCRMAVPPLPCADGWAGALHMFRSPWTAGCELLFSACAGARMLRSLRGAALLPLPVALGEAGAAASGQQRPFAVLRRQNLALMGSVFGLLLLAAVLLAVCVYRPLRRR